MVYEGLLWIGEDQGEKLCIRPEMANRHGLIAGATGTGKTVTLKVMAESFCDLGVPVFLADVKGDLAGMCRPGQNSPQMSARLESLGLKEAGFSYRSYPVCFWDIFGEKGLPLRTTISEMGPTLLARLMGLTDTQTDVLTIVFRIADEEGLLLLDTKDLRAMLLHVAQQNKEYASRYGRPPKTEHKQHPAESGVSGGAGGGAVFRRAGFGYQGLVSAGQPGQGDDQYSPQRKLDPQSQDVLHIYAVDGVGAV